MWAGLIFNEGYSWIIDIIKQVNSSESVDDLISNFIADLEKEKLSKIQEKARQDSPETKIKKKVITGKKNRESSEIEYGKNAADVEENALENLITRCENYLENVYVSEKKITEIFEATLGQNQDEWFNQRKIRLTASNFGKICSRRDQTDPSNLIKSILYVSQLSSREIEYGKLHESIARTQYEVKTGNKVALSGLIIDKNNPWLACSPDGLVFDPKDGNGLVEIKCIGSKDYRMSPIEQICEEKKNFYLRKNEQSFELKRNHQYYYQIQGQIIITNRHFCDFVVYNEPGLIYREDL
jgi:putative phage-type endonuclease